MAQLTCVTTVDNYLKHFQIAEHIASFNMVVDNRRLPGSVKNVFNPFISFLSSSLTNSFNN